MTFLEFNTLVDQIGKHSAPYYTLAANATEFKALTNESLRDFSIRTRCLYDDRLTLTLVATTSTYSFRSTGGAALCQVDTVGIEGRALLNILGEPGPWTVAEVRSTWPDWLSREFDKPILWMGLSPHHVRLWPTPDAVYTDCFYSGWLIHSTLSGNSDPLEIPDEYCYTAAVYAAVRLLGPNAAGSGLERMAALDVKAAERMGELLAAGEKIMFNGHRVGWSD